MNHYKKFDLESLMKNGRSLDELIAEDPKVGVKLALMFSNRIATLEKWISENTEHDGEKIGFQKHNGNTLKETTQ